MSYSEYFYDWLDRFHSRGQLPCKYIWKKVSVYMRKEFNSHWIVLGHQQNSTETLHKYRNIINFDN